MSNKPKKNIQVNREHESKVEKLEKDLNAAEQEVDFKVPKVPMSVGKKIAQVRVEKKLSQIELAKKLSINVVDLKNIENGSAVINHKIVNKICQHLKIKVSECK